MDALFPCLAAPDGRTVLTVDDVSLTDRQLLAAARRHADVLARMGIQPGDRVGVWTQPDLRTVVALVGGALAGVVTVPLNPRLGEREVAHIAADAAPRCCFAARPDERADCPLGPSIQVLLDMSEATCPEASPPILPADARPLLLIYTSGTTGAPKGAVLTAAGVAANLDGLARAWAWTAADTVVHALPLFHVHGLVLGLFGSLRVGGRLHWLPRFEPAELAAAVRGAILFAVPTMYVRLAELAERDPGVAADLAAARLLISGSAALSAREHRRIAALTGRGVYERYGLTETLIVCAVPTAGPPRPGLVGPPLPGVEVRLVDDQRRPLDVADDATLGEIAVRGPSVFAGYLGRPDATAAVRDDDGWFYTGDLATRTADGAYRIVGRRATDLIKSGGFKIGAGEIETCLLEHPEVAEVAVLGVADDDLGERIVAFVVARDPARPPLAQQLVDHVAGALAPHKRPRDVRFVEALPRNAMGKVIKARLNPP
ncbi:AMP-binding protein [Nannocystis radixulma]|uniref:AMP-binding protein n=1 Tax=Nannocystis radixulma TaxID=2995305 RepID=A0ABT5AZW4_9BACT|nr:AMP-binding protein [Nannocystis radixulma]MDC0667380.1 AMP-binding protein [Nannocystis radixulma]